MAKSVQIASHLYTKPPISAMPGARWDYREIALTKAQLEVAAANNAIIALGILPAGHRLLSLFAESDDLCTTNDLVFDIGILNAYYNTAVTSYFDGGGASRLATGAVVLGDRTIAYGNILTGSTIMQAGGRIDALALAVAMNNVSVDRYHDRIIAIDITTEAGTGAAGDFAIGYCIDME